MPNEGQKQYIERLQEKLLSWEQSPLALAVEEELEQLREEKAAVDLKQLEIMFKVGYYDNINIDSEEGYTLPDTHKFSQPLVKVLAAIRANEEIDGINIRERIQDPAFRFETEDEPTLSVQVSHSLVEVIEDIKESYTNSMTKKAIEKRNENADEFAKNLYDVIQKLKADENISSYRETVKALNAHHVPTYRGGEWHVKTLQDIKKRWKALGIDEPTTPK